MYRVGFPGWKLAARIGVPVLVRINVYRDEESDSFWATSRDLDGLTVSGKTLDELRLEIGGAASALLELELKRPTRATTELRIRDTTPCAA